MAIVITIMVLELKVPRGDSFGALATLLPTFVSYALSFIYLAIYGNNHHHMLQATSKVNGPILYSFGNRRVGFGLYWVVAMVWLVPDRRIEKVISE